jgi:cellulose synthase/poly-beta-1,6-N-acetylglucosamine synthase-like glycosyltransferase
VHYVFWISVALVTYTYVGYPALAILLGRVLRRSVVNGSYHPTVSIVIAAHNEAARIGATLENKLCLEYPLNKVQIIVVSDASTDGTDAIARQVGGLRVLVIRQEPRRGKTAALNLGVKEASGDIVVFADANSMYAADALHLLVRNFRDSQVGYVTGRLVYGGRTGAGIGSTAYMAYEDLLRRSETRLGSIVGVNGGIDAVRRSLYVPMQDEQLPDFVLPLSVVQRGFRVVYEPEAILNEASLTSSREEYRMRVRVALRAWWTLAEMRPLLNVRRYGLFSVQLFSHKALRYLAFGGLSTLYVTALALWSSGLCYQLVFVAGSSLLMLAAVGSVFEWLGGSAWIVSVPYYFIVINVAACHALVKFFLGRRQTTWTPRLG